MSIHNESLVSLNPTISGKVILNFNIKSTTVGLKDTFLFGFAIAKKTDYLVTVSLTAYDTTTKQTIVFVKKILILNKNKLNIVPFVTPISGSNSPNYDLKFTLNNNIMNLYLHGKKDSVVNWKGNVTVAESN